MPENKFQVGDYVRLGGADGRPLPFPHLRRGRIVRVSAVLPNQLFLGQRHTGYVIAGRKGLPPSVLASYELRAVGERDRKPRQAKARVAQALSPGAQ